MAIALLGYAVEQNLYDPKTERLVISKSDKVYILEKVSEDHHKCTDLKEFKEADLRKNATESRTAAKKDHGSNFSIGTITFGINYLFGEQAEENSSDNTFFEGIDPKMLPSVEELSTPRTDSDQLSASSTRGNSPIGRDSAVETSNPGETQEALIAQLEALKRNPYTFAPLIIATQERLLTVLNLQMQQV